MSGLLGLLGSRAYLFGLFRVLGFSVLSFLFFVCVCVCVCVFLSALGLGVCGLGV